MPSDHTKLTLSVDEAAVAKGKRYAREHGLSLSAVVNDYLLSLDGVGDEPLSERVQHLVGIGRGPADESDYRCHLREKYA